MAEGQQRRIAVILAADVFGYSRLMAKDEDSTLRTLKAHRNVIDGLIARHEGRIFNTAGDSVLAEFGSAVEAVRCAITIQDELRVRNAQLPEERRMEFRIGINVGDVLVDRENLYGDGVPRDLRPSLRRATSASLEASFPWSRTSFPTTLRILDRNE
ncbi:MAG: adenylate/guanylate cyclase domain-containing protein [Acidobacteriaceae bacterium]|nr:adenylate/guanylate cyclase domain-containing protein [Acidobacteriaceae bacterium]MBV9406766.1 adenylate/guanylate cyclase domain-containing protein [Acidobacteriaceae bacterium]